MAQNNGPRKLQCDCALTFGNKQALGEHVKQTGHMKPRWCAECCRLFGKEQDLKKHKQASPKHKNRPSMPSGNNVSQKIPQQNIPIAATGKSIAAAEVQKAPGGTKQKKGTGNTVQATQGSSSRLVLKAPAATSGPNKSYPWASKQKGAGLLKVLDTQCHSEAVLIEECYYAGASYNSARKKQRKFSDEQFLRTQPRVSGVARRAAVALDCEMVGIADGRDELAHLSAVDVLTGEILIDTLVLPIEPVVDWRTKYSGISLTKMSLARASGQALDGWPAARAKLFEFVDASTILVGQSLHFDLASLKIMHGRVIDTAVVVAEAVFGKGQRLRRRWSLKQLCRELLGLAIQTGSHGHDCLEDTLAARELLLWCVEKRGKLDAWAQKALVQYEAEQKKIKERQQAKARELERKRREREPPHRAVMPSYEEYGYDYDDDSEILHLTHEEFMEQIEYPTWYDARSLYD
ncbi:hypothetical protein AAE478_009933 [Parahypoxylon ruwenzoriense]